MHSALCIYTVNLTNHRKMKMFFTYYNELFSFGVFREWDEHFYCCFELAWILPRVIKACASRKNVTSLN